MLVTFVRKALHVRNRNKLLIVTAGIVMLVFLSRLSHEGKKQKLKNIETEARSRNIIRNAWKFQSLRIDSIVIVVEVKDRLDYLKQVIHGLSKVQGIEEVLLIFSHDVYDRHINKAIEEIDFCKVLQIFNPHSLQLHPKEFPGTDPDDCKPWMTVEEAKDAGCKNADHPDVNGEYRVAEFALMKHHWWWTLNEVFDNLQVMASHNGFVFFLDDDHYASKDFLHFAKLLIKAQPETCPYCKILSLGADEPTLNAQTASEVIIKPWNFDMTVAMRRSAWREIKYCAESFCKYDDYHWSYSLLHASEKCLPGDFLAAFAKGSRISKIDGCGLTAPRDDCDNDRWQFIREQHVMAIEKLFPESVVFHEEEGEANNIQPNGGWADPRDVELCMKMVT